MLGTIVKVFVVSPSDVDSVGFNSRGVRVGFALKLGKAWTEIPIYRDSSKLNSKVLSGISLEFEGISANLDISKMVGKRYLVKVLLADGLSYILGSCQPFSLDYAFGSGEQPGDTVGTSLKLQGNSLGVWHQLVEVVVPDPEPEILTITENFDTLDNVTFSTYPLGVEGCHSQPRAGIVRLLIPYIESLPSGLPNVQSIMHLAFPAARRFTNVKIKIDAISENLSLYYKPAGFQAVTPTGSFSTTFDPATMLWQYNPAAHADAGNPVEEFRFSFVDGIHKGDAWIDIDYIEWTWES